MTGHHITSLLVLSLVASCAAPRRVPLSEGDIARAREEILDVFRSGAESWSAGRLDDFVSDYLDDDRRTTYIGGGGLIRGRAAIRAAYAPRFAPGAQRDSLRFADIEIDVLAPGVANAIAFYELYRRVGGRDSVTARGPTSLVMQRANGRWFIVHDHSS